MKLFILVIVVVAGLVAFMAYRNLSMPAGLGPADGKLAALPSSPNAVSSQTDQDEKRVEPLPFKGDMATSRAQLLAALKAYGGIEVVRDDGSYLHAVATTATMRFRDDLEFLFDEQAGVIHVRSASRIGYSDGGLNRKRHEALADSYKASE